MAKNPLLHGAKQAADCRSLVQVNVFKDAAELMVGYVELIRQQGFSLRYLNIGGGPRH